MIDLTMTDKERWNKRRKVIYATLLFCAVCIGYIVYTEKDYRLYESISNGLILLAGSVISSYIFGAAWDDKNKIK